MRHAAFAVLAGALLTTAALAADKPADKPAPKPAAAASATRAEASAQGAETQGKGLRSWFKTLKERFLRRCATPWAPDPAPGQ